MARSAWKLPFVDGHVLKKVQAVVNSNKIGTIIKTWSRRSTIIPEFVGLTFHVYNGKRFIPVKVSEDMVNKKLGEFSPTRTFKSHGANKKAKKA
ncbi:MAG: 30S ribosomal protein S19 [Rickettsiales bacterium]|jgi:small subunit ribosomal protein S19|nr:30S ribosomal protein S19 [Rickettsiales bacterium]